MSSLTNLYVFSQHAQKKSSLAVLLMTFLFVSPALAEQPSEKIDCPSTASIGYVGVKEASSYSNKAYWLAWSKELFDTPQIWVLLVGSDLVASDEEDAIKKFNHKLKELVLTSGPEYSDSTNKWYCYYKEIKPSHYFFNVMVSTNMK